MDKLSTSRSDAFKVLPLRHLEKLDDKLIESLKHDKIIKIDENDKKARDRIVEAQFGLTDLPTQLRPRFARGKGGKRYRVISQLSPMMDGIDEQINYPIDPDAMELEETYEDVLRNAIANSERQRNKYMTPTMGQAATKRRVRSSPMLY